jgi:hypothetical protein
MDTQLDERSDESVEEMLHHDMYSPEELARLLDIPLETVQRAAMHGQLKAYIVDHHIIAIRRANVIDWLNRAPR